MKDLDLARIGARVGLAAAASSIVHISSDSQEQIEPGAGCTGCTLRTSSKAVLGARAAKSIQGWSLSDAVVKKSGVVRLVPAADGKTPRLQAISV